MPIDELTRLLKQATELEQDQLFAELRKGRTLHRLEREWNTTAEFILEAISRAQDITKRGVRGIIAELAFSEFVLKELKPGFVEQEIVGDLPYDALISDRIGQIKIQTKNQRLEKGVPKRTNAALVTRFPDIDGWFIAEAQKTRSGTARTAAEGLSAEATANTSTRPYRYGEFDILSVCLHPSTGDWKRFMHTPAKLLVPSVRDGALIATMQPVPTSRAFAWTDDLAECIKWVRHPETCPKSFQERAK